MPKPSNERNWSRYSGDVYVKDIRGVTLEMTFSSSSHEKSFARYATRIGSPPDDFAILPPVPSAAAPVRMARILTREV
ncbi:MAG: hypothetical protein CVU57_05490 [Deltaproteobacteria bacterium HGW-Deltaproteobacteria-15]|jgi:hypothetical protein|nr:MAG: hypothetical protein CVU57_05490 [Deltaproteobacteria bacterium HGW-Deltaproteobacteria-15]